jgi:hypothetical protein
VGGDVLFAYEAILALAEDPVREDLPFASRFVGIVNQARDLGVPDSVEIRLTRERQGADRRRIHHLHEAPARTAIVAAGEMGFDVRAPGRDVAVHRRVGQPAGGPRAVVLDGGIEDPVREELAGNCELGIRDLGHG